MLAMAKTAIIRLPNVKCCLYQLAACFMYISINSRIRSAQENSEAKIAIPAKKTGTPPGPGSQPISPDVTTRVLPNMSTSGFRM